VTWQVTQAVPADAAVLSLVIADAFHDLPLMALAEIPHSC
jgi:hypothetical protein